MMVEKVRPPSCPRRFLTFSSRKANGAVVIEDLCQIVEQRALRIAKETVRTAERILF